MSVGASLLARTSATPLLEVDLGAVGSNVRTLASLTPGQIMAVVKADAFGHGAVPVAHTALANGAASLGVATLAEAQDLRDAAITAPVLSWLNPVDAPFDDALRSNIDLAVPSVAHLSAISTAAVRTGGVARVHLHIDTGMNRDGAAPEEWNALASAARRAEQSGEVSVVGVMSHLPSAGSPHHPSTSIGRERFIDAARRLRRAGLRATTLHLAATEATLHHPSTHFDLSRIGAGLYGIGAALRPALRLTAPVIGVRDVPRGSGVGYGHAWTAERATRLALVPLGYADGIPRIAGAVAEVALHGHRRPLAGTVSMDQIVIDVGDMPVHLGDRITVFGNGDDGEPTVADWSRWAGTLPHEIMTGLGARVGRSYGGIR
ncbi:alanine racemase [Microbacterium terregens]|uniref:Alanine racemase n=1 Tax=Microbacterium terregens TaxID=69363 RepID=A0ABV5T1N8_9MICO